METGRRLPPIWVMGLSNASFGLTGGFCGVVLPELFAAHGIPAGHIAVAAALILSPSFWGFIIAPILDVRLSRRTYALILGTITALAVGITVAFPNRLAFAETVMLPGFLAATLYSGAVGGWMGSLITKKQDGELGIWFSVTNIGAGGLMMVLSGEVLHRFTPTVSALLTAGAILLPMASFIAIPSPPADRQLARESFGRFCREVASLLRQREVQTALLLFLLPAASFALVNVLGGMGKDFSASERTVSLYAGIGSTIAGIIGSFLLFPLVRRISLRPLYVSIGVVGALFTFSLVAMPHTPGSFAIAITGENLFQALAFSASNAIASEVIGPNNPFAATLFTLLVSASNLPLSYMQFLDGRGYDRAGLTGSYVTDAGVSITACILLAWLLSRWRKNRILSRAQ
jgi:MFS transporter, PAT family, beta-lactamase induction signal transducer AmpG